MSKPTYEYITQHPCINCILYAVAHLCREDDDARRLRLAPGLPVLRELEFEELWAQKEGEGEVKAHTHTRANTRTRVRTRAYARDVTTHAHIHDQRQTQVRTHAEVNEEMGFVRTKNTTTLVMKA